MSGLPVIPFVVVSDPPDQRGWVDALLVQGDPPAQPDGIASVEVETDRLFEANDPRADALLQLLRQRPYIVVSCETPTQDVPLLQMHYPPWRASREWHCLDALFDALGVEDWFVYAYGGGEEREMHIRNVAGGYTTVLRARRAHRPPTVFHPALCVVVADYIDTRVQIVEVTAESHKLDVTFTSLGVNYIDVAEVIDGPPEEVTDVPTD